MSPYQRLLAAIVQLPRRVPGNAPPSPTDKLWPANTHSDPDVLVPASPTVAYQCTYQTTLNNPKGGTLVGDMITFTDTALADLTTSFNTAGQPSMSCPAGREDQVVQNMRFNFVYPDGGSAIVDQLGANCSTITNGTLTKQAPNLPSSTRPAP